jgi:hypothetical protein
MEKPEPLFPAIAGCPNCGKRTRIKWESPKRLPAGIERIGALHCPACRKLFIRAVGGQEAVAALTDVLAHHSHANCEDETHDHSHEAKPFVRAQTDRYAYIEMP